MNHVPEDTEKHYRIVDFLLVLNTISSLVKCAQCDEKLEFRSCKKEGLGFEIQVKFNIHRQVKELVEATR